MLDFLRGLVGIAFGLGFAILVHEFGHFLWAKVTGVRVLKFSIGFGKFIVSRRIGETEYGIAWFPIGGYVMMHGAMNPETGEAIQGAVEESLGGEEIEASSGTDLVANREEPQAKTESEAGEEKSGKRGGLRRMVDAATSDSSALYNKPYYQKMLIYSGGVVMNWITAMVAMGVLWTIGFDVPKSPVNVVGAFAVAPEVVQAQVPLQRGDRIVAVEGDPVSDWDEFQVAYYQQIAREAAAERETDSSTQRKPKTVQATIERSGKGEMEVVLPATIQVEGKEIPALQYVVPQYPPFIEDVLPNKPADKAGLKHGDRIVQINGEPTEDWEEMAEIIRKNPGVPLEMEVKRGSKILTMTVVPEDNPKEPGTGQIGIYPGGPERVVLQEPFITSMVNAPGRTIGLTGTYLSFVGGVFGRLLDFQFRSVGEDLGGPIQIVQLAYRSARRGLTDFLQLFLSLNIALAVFNVLPIPLLDGSLMFFATYEVIARRPFPPRLHVPLLYAGLVLIILIFILVSVNDVVRMIP
jgi:regulator of sigma E protease